MKKIFTLLLVFLSTIVLFPQTIEQKNWLRNFAEQQNNLWESQRAEAESLAAKYNLPIRKEFPDGTVIEIQRVDNGVPVYHMTDNLGSAQTISSDKVWPGNDQGIFSLDGQGQTIGLWEAGGVPLSTHQELIGRAFLKDNGGSTTQHATHTAGTLIASGISASAKGMSNDGQIYYYNSSNDLSEVAAAAANGLNISSHSYGLITGWRYNFYGDNYWVWFGNPNISETEDYRFGFYTNESASWDLMLNNAPDLLVVKSAGNDRGDGPAPGTPHWVYPNHTTLYYTPRDIDGGTDGYECINDPKGIAKNTLTIGAVYKILNGYSQPSDVQMSSFSNWGPTDDGRIKPDIVAAGVGLNSSSNESNTSYAVLSGTSMSTPSVAGSAGLLLELQDQLYGSPPLHSSTIKGILLHTADEAGSNMGPDYVFGWGLMNTFKAARLIKLNKEINGNTLIKEETLNNGSQYNLQVESNGSEPLKVTICWNDPPGTPPPISLNPTDLMLVNDLDLEITGPNSITYYPWVLNPSDPLAAAATGNNFRDNIEQVFIENPVAGSYTISISHKNTIVNNSQDFSLIMTGNVIPLPASVTLLSPASGSIDVPVDVTLSWTIAEKAFEYDLQISTDENFSDIVYENDKVPGVNYQLNQSVVQQFQHYYWRVRSKNSGGYGEWSEVWDFTTILLIPGRPFLTAPATNAINVPITPVLSWSCTGVIERFWLQVSKNSTFTDLVVNDSTITDSSFQTDSLQEVTRYFWKVKAINAVGSSNFSFVRFFTTELYAPANLTASRTQENHVNLTWEDRSEYETKYYILRKIDGNDYMLLDSIIAENQNTYLDTATATGNLFYRVYVANDAARSDSSNEAMVNITSINDKEKILPEDFVLYQNYPNPFNPTTVISFGLPAEGSVKITIYNFLGEKMEELFKGTLTAGYYNYEWNAGKYSSGLYFYSVDMTLSDGKHFNNTRKMLLIK